MEIVASNTKITIIEIINDIVSRMELRIISNSALLLFSPLVSSLTGFSLNFFIIFLLGKINPVAERREDGLI